MLRLFVERLMNIRCCCKQDASAYRTMLYPNHYSEAPENEYCGDAKAWRHAEQSRRLGASAPRLYRREAPRAAPPACTPSPLSPSDAHSPPRRPENHPTRPKSTQQRSGAPRDGLPRRKAEPAGRRRRPAAQKRPETSSKTTEKRPTTPSSAQRRPSPRHSRARRTTATPVNARERLSAVRSSTQQRPATPSSATKRPAAKERLRGNAGGPNSASPALSTQQRPPSTGNPPVSGREPPPTATPAGLRHSRWDGLLWGGSAAALGDKVRGGQPGGCVGQGTAQNHLALLSRPGSVRDSIRRPS